MAPRIRVLARRLNGMSTMPPIVYSAAVYPDDEDIHVMPMWSCPHEHETPVAAQQCGFDWLEGKAGESS